MADLSRQPRGLLKNGSGFMTADLAKGQGMRAKITCTIVFMIPLAWIILFLLIGTSAYGETTEEAFDRLIRGQWRSESGSVTLCDTMKCTLTHVSPHAARSGYYLGEMTETDFQYIGDNKFYIKTKLRCLDQRNCGGIYEHWVRVIATVNESSMSYDHTERAPWDNKIFPRELYTSAGRLAAAPPSAGYTPPRQELFKTPSGDEPKMKTYDPGRKIALVIGNSQYSTAHLKNPVNDASDMAAALKALGFEVILKKNARLQEMDEAIESFGQRLKRGGVGLFYYAGHGAQVNGINYLIPVGARINKESDVKYQAVDANRILDEMANANNGLNIVLLDACRDNPFAKSFRSASRGLAIISNAPNGTFISYSTGPGQVARDGEGRNSPYTKALLENISRPGLPIEQVFKKVRQRLDVETGGLQIPWELSSLKGDFYFVPDRKP